MTGVQTCALPICWRCKIGATGQVGKLVFGVIILVVGIGIVTGLDKVLQTWLVSISPEWLTELTTRY